MKKCYDCAHVEMCGWRKEVKEQGCEFFDDGMVWIPCSERLPEEHESIWAKAKGTDRWSEAMWEKQSDEVIVTELFEDGTTRTDTACTHDGEWYVKVKIVKRKIIAWMPLPEPYKGE